MQPEKPSLPQHFTGTIHAIPYCHADIAWIHTRAWHIDRYVRLMDEVLARLEADPSYCYYIDTWVELARPYLDARPERRADLCRYMAEGRLAVCGGQYGNLRCTTAGNETSLRNMQAGYRCWREVWPDFEPHCYSNLDVTFGHSQLPQLLSLMGMELLFAGRPWQTLDAEGIPSACYWKGLSGDKILLYRDPGIGLFQEGERHGATWDEDWEAVVQGIWAGYLARHAVDGVEDLCLCLGCDDTRPDRFWGDKPADYDALMCLWNERMPSRMVYSTLDKLLARLKEQSSRLLQVEGPLDMTDVHYNCAWNGRQGIWWLREQADRLLVEAEFFNSLSVLARKGSFPTGQLQAAWEELLNWTPHAVQALFDEDWREGVLALESVAATARGLSKIAVEALIGKTLPVDARGLALVNPLPVVRCEVTQLWVMNSDLRRDLARLLDVQGREVPFQVIGAPVGNPELELLAEVEVPAGGFTILGLEWEPASPDINYLEAAKYYRTKYGAPEQTPLTKSQFMLASDRLKLFFSDGQLVEFTDLVSGVRHEAPVGASFLEPVCYPVTRGDDWYVASIADEPDPFVVDELRLDETGPLRWRITRTGRTGGFWVRQHLDLYKGETSVHSTCAFLPPADQSDTFLALSLPVEDDADFAVDIPFGVEPRHVASIQYGIAERQIPGFFWGRTWTLVDEAKEALGFVAEDGDKFFRVFGKPRRLAHFLAQKTRNFEHGWEAYAFKSGGGGYQTFKHQLLAGSKPKLQAELIQLAERIRHPMQQLEAPRTLIGRQSSLISLAPVSVSLSALYFEGDNLIIRLVQLADESVEAEVSLPFEAMRAERINLKGEVIQSEPGCEGKTLRIRLGPWQVATLRVPRT